MCDVVPFEDVFIFWVRGTNQLRRVQDEGGDTPPPLTRSCPYRTREMAIQATRCPHCTSQVEAA